jgi:hypothetical protein
MNTELRDLMNLEGELTADELDQVTGGLSQSVKNGILEFIYDALPVEGQLLRTAGAIIDGIRR